LSHIDSIDFQSFISSEQAIQILTNVAYEFSGMVRVLQMDREEMLPRYEAAEYLVMSFDISANGMVPYQSGAQVVQTPFIDIFGNPYQTAISTLAGL